jgi:hypothetical protein
MLAGEWNSARSCGVVAGRVRDHSCYEETMGNCVTCGDELHPERAEKYDYCTNPGCRERNAKGLDIVAVGVNKAADQYVVPNERTKREMAAGRYKKEPGVPASVRPRPEPTARPARGSSSSAPTSWQARSAHHPRWSETQLNLARIYRSMGLKPEEIAKKLGVSFSEATRLLLAATTELRR